MDMYKSLLPTRIYKIGTIDPEITPYIQSKEISILNRGLRCPYISPLLVEVDIGRKQLTTSLDHKNRPRYFINAVQ